MRGLQIFLTIMGVIAVVAILALVAVYVMAILTPDLRTSMRPVVLSAEAADSLNNKFSDLRSIAAEAQSNNAKKDVKLVFTEEEVDSALVMMLAEGNLPAKEILVNFNEDYILIYVAWNIPWFPVKTALIGQIDAVDGTPKATIRNVYVGKLTVPNDMNENIQNLANMLIKLNAPLEELNLNIKQVSIGEGQVVFNGTIGNSAE